MNIIPPNNVLNRKLLEVQETRVHMQNQENLRSRGEVLERKSKKKTSSRTRKEGGHPEMEGEGYNGGQGYLMSERLKTLQKRKKRKKL